MFLKPSSRLILILLLWLLLPAIALAAKIKIDVNTDRTDAFYKVGEKVKFSVRVTSDGKPVTDGDIKYVVSEDGVNIMKQGSLELGLEPTVVGARMKKPGFMRCDIYYRPKAPKPEKTDKGKTDEKKLGGGKPAKQIIAMASAAISPEEIKMSMPVPDDFDEFWTGQKKRLTEMPAEPKLTPVDSGSENMECFDVQIDCPGGAPVSGYFGRPKDAKPKSLPAVLWVHGAGWSSSVLAYAKYAEQLGMLSMDINAHGIPNGKPAEYYKNLSETDLKEYYWRGRNNREEVYFVGMFLRLLRALDFLCSQPQWDGKTLIVIGHSQGGAQALAAAGLDERVTFIGTGVPAMCDHSGIAIGRTVGWPFIVTKDKKGKPNEQILEASRYIDCVNFATRAKADAIMSVGFIDTTCPPTTCYAAYNQLRGKKKVINKPKMGHAAPGYIQKAFEKAFKAHAKEQSGK